MARIAFHAIHIYCAGTAAMVNNAFAKPSSLRSADLPEHADMECRHYLVDLEFYS